MNSPLFRVDNLHVQPAENPNGEILQGLDLTVDAGEVHAIIGSAGAGRSALGSTLMGSPQYDVVSGGIHFKGDDVTDWPTDERAKAGMFLAFEAPEEIPGVSLVQLLGRALSARRDVDRSGLELRDSTTGWMKRLDMDASFVDRVLDEDFSGTQRTRTEIVQMAILEPEIAILDETDPGLDVEALRLVAHGLREVRADLPGMGVILITDHQHLLAEVTPDHVHVLVDGRIVASGGMDLAARFERDGDEAFRPVSTGSGTA